MNPNNNCPIIWSSVYISPEGYINLCCVSHEHIYNPVRYNLDQIESLNKFFNQNHYLELRKKKY